MLQQAIKTIRIFLPSTGSVTHQQIIEAVEQVLHIPNYSDLDKNILIREVQAIYNIRVDDFRIIEAADRRVPWINENRGKITWNFYNRYREYLQSDKNYPETVLLQLDKLTDRTLDGLFNPTMRDGISKYGLVVGQVQSGKTSNYTGLICKAADAGYKLIIVLAGIHNNLRSQTQLRLDEGFLGFDTQHQRAFDQNGIKIGVGRIDQKGIAHSLTSSLDNGDFTAGAASSLGINFNTNEPIIAIVKKNSKVLERVLRWLTAQSVEMPDGRKFIDNKSILMIDDEADNASINTNPDEDKSTKINGLIRDILRLFYKSGYVGYTATPFANIFIPIEEDQIFPRDFIINIPASSNYIGPDKVFGIRPLEDDELSDTVLPIVNRINDYHDFIPNGHKKVGPLPDELPDSLILAIKSFIITCAVRRLRGQENVHNSMLIHVSRFIVWQNQIKELVENVFNFYRRGIEFNTPKIIEELREVFEVDSADYKSYKTISEQILSTNLRDIDSNIQVHLWAGVKSHLHEAASRIIVREINGGSGDALNYFDHKNGLSVIAIGGDKLSRGLTLEGLSVSYYLRASRMYDTLMQMGRWFGYRPGYVDLCRLFTSRELNEWFCHITMASEELRSEFDYMADIAGSTPEQYALKVRTHPGVLQISASNKIRRAVNVDVSWAGRLVESYQLQKNPVVIENNLKATIELISSLDNSFKKNQNNYLWINVNPDFVKLFLSKFKVPDSLVRVDPANLLQFINVQMSNGELTNWNIGLMSKSVTPDRFIIKSDTNKFDIGYWYRSNADDRTDTSTYFIRKNHIISPKDEFIDLTDLEYRDAMTRTISYHGQNNKEYKNDYPKGEIVRHEFRDPKKPLLLIYFLDPEGADLPKESNPLIGIAISFPGSRFNASVRYAVHSQLLDLFKIDDDIENDNNDED
ncbi:MAG: Z1 domain-containing protein [Saprospiraceae bacterium]|nr:Z1 domain-containing protein [Saprospiraceae bacterium]